MNLCRIAQDFQRGKAPQKEPVQVSLATSLCGFLFIRAMMPRILDPSTDCSLSHMMSLHPFEFDSPWTLTACTKRLLPGS